MSRASSDVFDKVFDVFLNDKTFWHAPHIIRVVRNDRKAHGDGARAAGDRDVVDSANALTKAKMRSNVYALTPSQSPGCTAPKIMAARTTSEMNMPDCPDVFPCRYDAHRKAHAMFLRCACSMNAADQKNENAPGLIALDQIECFLIGRRRPMMTTKPGISRVTSGHEFAHLRVRKVAVNRVCHHKATDFSHICRPLLFQPRWRSQCRS
jgi:hypothetical protein